MKRGDEKFASHRGRLFGMTGDSRSASVPFLHLKSQKVDAPKTPKKTRSPLTLLAESRSRMTQHESSSMGELEARLLVS